MKKTVTLCIVGIGGLLLGVLITSIFSYYIHHQLMQAKITYTWALFEEPFFSYTNKLSNEVDTDQKIKLYKTWIKAYKNLSKNYKEYETLHREFSFGLAISKAKLAVYLERLGRKNKAKSYYQASLKFLRNYDSQVININNKKELKKFVKKMTYNNNNN